MNKKNVNALIACNYWNLPSLTMISNFSIEISRSLLVNSYRLIPTIDHFTVPCSVTRPLNESEAEVDLASIQTSLLFLCKSCCYNANEFLFT